MGPGHPVAFSKFLNSMNVKSVFIIEAKVFCLSKSKSQTDHLYKTKSLTYFFIAKKKRKKE